MTYFWNVHFICSDLSLPWESEIIEREIWNEGPFKPFPSKEAVVPMPASGWREHTELLSGFTAVLSAPALQNGTPKASPQLCFLLPPPSPSFCYSCGVTQKDGLGAI